MNGPASFERGTDEALALCGDWTAAGLGRTGARLATRPGRRPGRLDVRRLGRFDTAGAAALLEAGVDPAVPGLETRQDVTALLALAAGARRPAAPPSPGPTGGVAGELGHIGRGVERLTAEIYASAVFTGRLLVTLARVALQPSRLRWTPTVSLMERAGLDAMPIIMVTSFFVGATLAFLGQDILRQYGGQVYTVEFVGVSELREFGLLVTAVILAGRSSSSFAAEIGAMRMNQEIDAMRVMGVDPFEALVVPRFLALLAMTPLLTFAAVAAGLFGGMLVIWATLGLAPAFFLQRLADTVGAKPFYLGLLKTPVIAVLVAGIGCRQGLEVGGDVESLGRRVTAAVVQALFAMLMADALFAFVTVELGL